MYYLVVAGVIIVNFIPKEKLAYEIKEANEDYRDKVVEVRKHSTTEVNKMIHCFNKPYNKEIEVLK